MDLAMGNFFPKFLDREIVAIFFQRVFGQVLISLRSREDHNSCY